MERLLGRSELFSKYTNEEINKSSCLVIQIAIKFMYKYIIFGDIVGTFVYIGSTCNFFFYMHSLVYTAQNKRNKLKFKNQSLHPKMLRQYTFAHKTGDVVNDVTTALRTQ